MKRVGKPNQIVWDLHQDTLKDRNFKICNSYFFSISPQYTQFSKGYCTLLIFWLPLVWINTSMHLERDPLSSLQVWASTSLQDSVHTSDKLFLVIFKPGLWGGQFFNTVALSSANVMLPVAWGMDLCNTGISYLHSRLIFFSNWVYLTLFKLSKILTNFSWTITFDVYSKHKILFPQMSLFLLYNVDHFAIL